MEMTALSRERPFPGLRPFAFADHPFFFGRDDQVYAIYRLLDRSRFIAVVGTSGGGKSSLVRAGLLPLLREETIQPGARQWKFFEMRPGDSPISSLVEALAGTRPAADADEVKHAVYAARRERIAYAFRHSSFGLVEALSDLNDVEGHAVLLLVDQFEELFRFSSLDRSAHRDPAEDARRREEAARFVQLLLEASRSQDPQIHVLITMRSDFIGDCARFHGLPEAVSATQFLVPSLTRDQREDVIRKPVEKAEASIDGALVERLLNDSNDEFDLPVLQHCLMRLWDKAGLAATPTVITTADADLRAPPGEAPSATQTRRLRLEYYDEVGRIARALSLHADAIMASLPGLEVAVEQTFRALSDVDKDGRATRRALSFQRLLAETGILDEQLRRVVDRFRAEDCSFLFPAPSAEPILKPDTRIDVGHESLLRRWERISSAPASELAADTGQSEGGWLAAEEADGRTYRALLGLIDCAPRGTRVTLPLDQVEARTKWWTSHTRTPAWTQRYGGGLDRVEQLFRESNDALRAEQQRQEAAEAARREGEIKSARMEAERQKAEAEAALERTRSRSTRWLALLAGALTVVTAAFAYFTYQRYQSAEIKRVEALAIQTRFLADRSKRETQQGNTRGGILLALEALDRQKDVKRDIPDPRVALYAALAAHITERIAANYDREQPIEIDFGGERLLNLSGPNKLLVLDSAGKTLAELTHDESIAEAFFDEDGKRLVTASADKTARIWNADGTLIATLPHPDAVSNAAFNFDGTRVVTIAGDHAVRVWSSDGKPSSESQRRPLAEFPHDTAVSLAKLNRDGSKVVTLADDGKVRVFEIEGRNVTIFSHPEDVTAARFSPDGTRLLTISRDRTVRLWDLKNSATPLAAYPHDSAVTDAIFSPNGSEIATASEDQAVRIWEITAEPQAGAAQRAAQTLRHEGSPKLVKFSKDGTVILTVASDKVARLWNANGNKIANLPHNQDIADAAFGPDETTIVTASDGEVRNWALQNDLVKPLHRPGELNAVTINADGTRILGGGGTVRRIRAWDERGQEVQGRPVRGTLLSSRWFAQRTQILSRLYENYQISDLRGRTLLDVPGSIYAVSADASRIAIVSGKDKSLKLWSGRGDPTSVTLEKDVARIMLNRDGSRILLVARDGTMELRNQAGEKLTAVGPRADGDAAQIEKDAAKGAPRQTPRQTVAKPDTPRLSLERATILLDATGTRILKIDPDAASAELFGDSVRPPTLIPIQGLTRLATFSPDGAKILFRTGATAQLWTADGGRVMPLGHGAEINSAEFSSDGSRILTASADKTARLWDADGHPLVTLPHGRAVRSATFAASGGRILTIGVDNTVRVWTLDGRQIIELPHEGRVNASIDAAGKRLVTASSEGVARVFTLYDQVDDLTGMARRLLLTPLTQEEREQFFVQ